jgi:DNA-binding NarL/FixJ family response regulator
VPEGLVVERLDVDGEEMLVFSWHDAPADVAALTESERDVLARIVDGASNAEIAKARGTSVRTVANQVAKLLEKTKAASRYELIRRYAGARRR